MIAKAKKLANVVYSVIEKSVNRVLIGKTFWKVLALPSILFCTNIIGLNASEIEKLQVIENGVYRKILGAPSYAPNCTLRGEIGSSTMKARVAKGMIKYVKSVVFRDNRVLHDILRRNLEKKLGWCKNVEKAVCGVGLDVGEIMRRDENDLVEVIKKWDDDLWNEEKKSKKSIELYAKYREKIGSGDDYDNTEASVILYRMRTNTLKLNDRQRFVQGSTACELCEAPLEDLMHVILDCYRLAEPRQRVTLLQRPNPEDREALLGCVLFGRNSESRRESLAAIYRLRKKLIERRT